MKRVLHATPAVLRSRVLWAVPVVLGLTALLAFGFGKNPSAVPDPLVGHAAPTFALKTTDGKTVTLGSLRGKPVVMNFFASWCTSCKEQESNLVAAARKWHRKATFIGVIYEDYPPSAAASFTREFGGTWPDLVDPHGSVSVDYGVTGIPETFFINRAGTIVSHTDQLSPMVLRTGILSALKPA